MVDTESRLERPTHDAVVGQVDSVDAVVEDSEMLMLGDRVAEAKRKEGQGAPL